MQLRRRLGEGFIQSLEFPFWPSAAWRGQARWANVYLVEARTAALGDAARGGVGCRLSPALTSEPAKKSDET